MELLDEANREGQSKFCLLEFLKDSKRDMRKLYAFSAGILFRVTKKNYVDERKKEIIELMHVRKGFNNLRQINQSGMKDANWILSKEMIDWYDATPPFDHECIAIFQN